VEEVPDLTVPIHGTSGSTTTASGSDASTYRALFPLWPGLPLAQPSGTSASLGYVWLGGTMLQLGLEYAPSPPFDSGSPETAPAAILEAYRARIAPLIPRREAEAREAAARLTGLAGS
jgi:hypothetical protein